MADLPRHFYRAFGLEQGNLRQMFAPDVWVCGLRAAAKGNMAGAPVGDPWQMPGLFLVQGDKILWQHNFRHAGDHPDFAAIIKHLPADIKDMDNGALNMP